LPDRCIKLFSFEGDVVMDPFLGSGTTLMASWKNRRVGIGIELDMGYCELAQQRLEKFAKDAVSESNGVNPELFQEEPPERN
jgi:site-specific DNA-methyltransferase (adenine-specific)